MFLLSSVVLGILVSGCAQKNCKKVSGVVNIDNKKRIFFEKKYPASWGDPKKFILSFKEDPCTHCKRSVSIDLQCPSQCVQKEDSVSNDPCKGSKECGEDNLYYDTVHSKWIEKSYCDTADPLLRYIDDIVDQLLRSPKMKGRYISNIAVTSFVNLHNFQQSSNFGRLLSETLITALTRRGLDVVDFRGQKAITLKKREGEFFLSRDASRLKPKFYNTNIVVGTYGLYGDRLVLNVRIMNNRTGKVIAAAESIITDPKLLAQICQDGLCKERPKEAMISIQQDPCDDGKPCE